MDALNAIEIERALHEAGVESGNTVFAHFDTLRITSEDRARSRMYLAEAKRKTLMSASTSLPDFYRSLGMKAELTRADQKTFDRIFQLIHKTNQFNLTTRRYTEAELRAILASASHEVCILRLQDKLGGERDYGRHGHPQGGGRLGTRELSPELSDHRPYG